MKKNLAVLIAFVLLSTTMNAQSAYSNIKKMQAKLGTINKSYFELQSKERFGSSYVYKKRVFTMQNSPKKIYMKDLNDGVELLYVVGWNSNKCYINPNGFPWVNVSLSMYDSKVVSETHHTLDDVGLNFVLELLNGFERVAKQKNKDIVSLYESKGEVIFDGKPCYKVELTPPYTFKYITYTTKRDQTLMQLSRRIVASDYLMKIKNNLSYTRTIKKGTKLIVPNAYAKKVIVYIDKKTYVPLVQMLYDEKGLFEKFEYRKINLYPKFNSKEFTPDCSKYGF